MDMDRVYTIAEDEAEEIEAWQERHNETCRRGLTSIGAIRSSKYRIAFRQTSVITDLDVICDCGEVFHSDKRMARI